MTMLLVLASSSGFIYREPCMQLLLFHPTFSGQVHASQSAGRSRRASRALPANRSIERVADCCAIVLLWAPAF